MVLPTLLLYAFTLSNLVTANRDFIMYSISICQDYMTQHGILHEYIKFLLTAPLAGTYERVLASN